MKHLLVFLLFVLFIQNINSQRFNGPDVPDYDPETGSTAYPQSDGSVIIYFPTETGSNIYDCPETGQTCETTNCNEDLEACKAKLEDATGGGSPGNPGGNNPGESTPNKPGKGKGKKKKQSAEIAEVLQKLPAWNSQRAYFKKPDGEWVEIRNPKAWTQKIVKGK